MWGHLPAHDHGVMDPAPAPYLIRINGHLGATMLSAFPALALAHHGAQTVLTGLLDRSALYGVLAEIEALGLDLVEIRRLMPEGRSPESGDNCSPLWPLTSAVAKSDDDHRHTRRDKSGFRERGSQLRPRTSAWPGIRLYGGTNRAGTGVGAILTCLCSNSRVRRGHRRTHDGSGCTDVDV
jgi:hypothetical protein